MRSNAEKKIAPSNPVGNPVPFPIAVLNYLSDIYDVLVDIRDRLDSDARS
jgi:hypothetical protein